MNEALIRRPRQTTSGCKAGRGRTGTFGIMDIALNQSLHTYVLLNCLRERERERVASKDSPAEGPVAADASGSITINVQRPVSGLLQNAGVPVKIPAFSSSTSSFLLHLYSFLFPFFFFPRW